MSNGDTGVFSVDASSGLIVLAHGLNYEARTLYTLTMVAEDGGGLKVGGWEGRGLGRLLC